MRYIFLIGWLFMGSNLLYAQGTPPAANRGDKRFQFEVGYLSNSVYLGRQDSVTTPYITPMFTYYHRSGFYIDCSLSYLPGNAARLDLGTIDLGYLFQAGEKWSGELYLSKYFYNDRSTAVKSSINTFFSSSLAYDASIITLNGGVDIGFSSGTDWFVHYGISYPFSWGEEQRSWSIEPSIIAYAGTQQFASRRRLRRPPPGFSSISISGANTFNVLDYEFSVPFTYDTDRWGLSIYPTYAVPLNPVAVTLPNGNTLFKEALSNNFYGEVKLYIKF